MPRREVQRQERHDVRRHGDSHDPNDFFGVDVEKMRPKAQVATGLAVILPVAFSGVFLIAAFPNFWWIFMTYFWVIFPAFGLLIRDIAGLWDEEDKPSIGNGEERELLQALREHGELTPARAAIETSLTVAEADEMLKGLAEGGHLEVRVRGGGLFYSLWGPEPAVLEPGERG